MVTKTKSMNIFISIPFPISNFPAHQKQISQDKDAGHPQIIPYIRREIIEAIVCPNKHCRYPPVANKMGREGGCEE
jgi:hypothetical protein